MSQVYEHVLRGHIACGKCGSLLYRNEQSLLQCLNHKCENWHITFAEPRIQLEVIIPRQRAQADSLVTEQLYPRKSE